MGLRPRSDRQRRGRRARDHRAGVSSAEPAGTIGREYRPGRLQHPAVVDIARAGPGGGGETHGGPRLEPSGALPSGFRRLLGDAVAAAAVDGGAGMFRIPRRLARAGRGRRGARQAPRYLPGRVQCRRRRPHHRPPSPRPSTKAKLKSPPVDSSCWHGPVPPRCRRWWTRSRGRTTKTPSAIPCGNASSRSRSTSPGWRWPWWACPSSPWWL
jgi:hypothetical protein